ncbi:type II secretion system secretin GspD [Bradyrhizobium arachidis]|uniref:Type II secretion system protein GspD n=2 Tax=Nitrobacteraceae TaxID=41294 RepID=A0AAE7NRV8_9BRAD|nr:MULTISPECIES: type II secretion system secretin GspD [Bradyrhizobium]QOG23798.1 type II secretion system protein GspD [Bradyrhizobium sp. SEMIA]QOZ69947.1 type II secretion system protein GspD [Bradyrhizobium arachidis]UFW53899.1 type II secretion system secretin GspD [Bradyrhizobium arachidis]
MISVLLGSCNTVGSIADADNNRDPDVFDKVRSVDLLPRYPQQLPQRQLSTGPKAKTAIYAADPGEDAATATSAQAATTSADKFELNFDNSPIASVAKIVLGDILGVGYVIDPRVQGNISLSSGRPIPKTDVVFALENALRLVGVALVRDDTGYRLMPQADAVGVGTADAADRMTPGYGITVVPLQYVSAQTVIKLVDSFATKQGMIRADTSRNLIMIQGTGSERRNAVDLVLSFDADFLKGQSVGIFPVQNSNPGPIIVELEKIVDSGEGGMTQNLIKFQSIARMNAVLAVTRKPELLQRVETWVRRLDTTNTGRSAVHVYRVKFGDAKQIARVLNDVFGGSSSSGASSSPLDSPAGQVAPGSGASASSSGGSALNRLSASPTGQSSGSGGFGSSGRGSGSSGSAMTADASSGNQASYGAGSSAQGGGSLFDNSASSQSGGRGGPGGAGVLDGVRITADSVNNTLLIYASQEQYRTIEQTIKEVDQPQLQVAIDATIAEVTLTDDLQYGIQSYIMSRDLGLKPNTGSFGYNGASAVAAAATDVVLQRAIPGFNFLVGSAQTPRAVLNALHAITDVKVLSNPSVVVIDNQIATLQVGDEIPIQTGSATVLTGSNTIANTTDYRSTGIILRVVPRINANGNVRLDVEQEISNPVSNSSSGSSSTSTNSLTPTVSTRKVRSSVAVASGQTVLLAGLISDSQTKSRSGIPGLDQIPGLGEVVFGQTDKQVKRTELIIFIRPQIIRDGADAHFVAEELRTKLRGTINAIGPKQTGPTTYR